MDEGDFCDGVWIKQLHSQDWGSQLEDRSFGSWFGFSCRTLPHPRDETPGARRILLPTHRTSILCRQWGVPCLPPPAVSPHIRTARVRCAEVATLPPSTIHRSRVSGSPLYLPPAAPSHYPLIHRHIRCQDTGSPCVSGVAPYLICQPVGPPHPALRFHLPHHGSPVGATVPSPVRSPPSRAQALHRPSGPPYVRIGSTHGLSA